MEGLLIIGPSHISSGIGGVSIHVQRLRDYLVRCNQPFEFVDYKSKGFAYTLKAISGCSVAHIHISNVYAQFILVLFARLLKKKTIVTFHGDLGRFSKCRNTLQYLSIRCCSTPIVLNENSQKIAKCMNSNSLMIPAFIPPIVDEMLPVHIIKQIEQFKSQKFKKIYATNAFSFSVDKDGNEVYGISELILIFKNLHEYGLIFSDPSSKYSEWLSKFNQDIPGNILIINEKHSFYETLKHVDGMIRNTTTDGDSLSIKEALFLGKIVLCTDVVPRHPSCKVYKKNDMLKLLFDFFNFKISK